MGAIGDFINVFRMREPDDEYYDDEDYMDDDVSTVSSFKKSSRDYADDEKTARKPIQKVTSISNRKKLNTESGNVFGIKPETMEDAKIITETLLEGRTVVLNLENIDIEIARRILDFAMGSTYALNGIMQKISNSIFIIVPNGIEISGAFQDLIGSS